MPFIIVGVLILTVVVAGYIIINRFFKIAFIRDDRERSAAQRLNVPWSIYIDDITKGELNFFDMTAERVQITSYDGLKLRGLFVAHPNPKGTVIMMHGYRSDGFADFSTLFGFYRSLGFNILLPHQRAHLTSEGKYITFGLKERYDCLYWANFVRQKAEGDIWLLGVSMGASTVMMASSLNLPKRVKGIIADCGFTSPWDELKYVLKRDYHLPPFPIMHLVNRRFKRICGVGLKDLSCTDTLKKCSVPVLFIHGSADDFVPCDMTTENYDACKAPKQKYICKGAAHAVTCWVDPRGYRQGVRAFIEKYS